MSFVNKTIVITGAAGNLGRAVTQVFMEQGARLVLLDLRADDLQRTFGKDNTAVALAPVDLLDPEAIGVVVDAAVDRYGRIDVLCNLAGGFLMGEPVHQTSGASWNAMFDRNVRTLLNMSQAVVPHMSAKGGGKIVNIGAFAAQRGLAGMGAYIAAKSAVIRLTESMAAELREKNINVNCVLPTIVDTPENRAAMPAADPTRWVAPQDLAAVISFLASGAARAVHGVALPVTGLS